MWLERGRRFPAVPGRDCEDPKPTRMAILGRLVSGLAHRRAVGVINNLCRWGYDAGETAALGPGQWLVQALTGPGEGAMAVPSALLVCLAGARAAAPMPPTLHAGSVGPFHRIPAETIDVFVPHLPE
jgi:hypothetical protein